MSWTVRALPNSHASTIGCMDSPHLTGQHPTRRITPSVHYFGSAVALITTLNEDGSSNITPISSAWSLGQHYVLGMAIWNHGAVNLRRTGECVINFPDAALATNIEHIAATTGAAVIPKPKLGAYRTELDKWTLASFTPRTSEEVTPLRIDECPVQIESTLAGSLPIDEDFCAYHVNVKAVHVHESVTIAGTHHVDVNAWNPLYYTFRHYFAQGLRVGKSFKAEV